MLSISLNEDVDSNKYLNIIRNILILRRNLQLTTKLFVRRPPVNNLPVKLNHLWTWTVLNLLNWKKRFSKDGSRENQSNRIQRLRF